MTKVVSRAHTAKAKVPMPADCDIHPYCQAQGCTADPNHCQRAQDIRAIRVGNASAAARARDNQFEANKPRMTSNQREGNSP